MRSYRTTIAAAISLVLIQSIQAEELKADHGESIDLGVVSGFAYYTVESKGFHVVVTLARPGESGVPYRIESVLTPGQNLIISMPHGLGVGSDLIEIRRIDDQVLVHKTALEN